MLENFFGVTNTVLSGVALLIYLSAILSPYTAPVKESLFLTAIAVAATAKVLQYSAIVALFHKSTYLNRISFIDAGWIFVTHYVLFNSVNNLIYRRDPTAFNQPSEDPEKTPEDPGFNLFYYSVITSMTIGYGDWYPKSRAAKVSIIFQVMDAYLLFAFMVGNINQFLHNL